MWLVLFWPLFPFFLHLGVVAYWVTSALYPFNSPGPPLPLSHQRPQLSARSFFALITGSDRSQRLEECCTKLWWLSLVLLFSRMYFFLREACWSIVLTQKLDHQDASFVHPFTSDQNSMDKLGSPGASFKGPLLSAFPLPPRGSDQHG